MSDTLRWYYAVVALDAVGLAASFGLWVSGCCLKRTTHDLGPFMTFARAGLGLTTLSFLFSMTSLALSLDRYNREEYDLDYDFLRATYQLGNLSYVLGWLATIFAFLGIIALGNRIVRARVGVAPAWPKWASYVWGGIIAALVIARYGISVYVSERSVDSLWTGPSLNWEVVESGEDLGFAIEIIWFATALVLFAASAVVVAKHRISTMSSAALLLATAAFFCRATYVFAVGLRYEIDVEFGWRDSDPELPVLAVIFASWAGLASLGFLLLAGSRGGITAPHSKKANADAPMGSV